MAKGIDNNKILQITENFVTSESKRGSIEHKVGYKYSSNEVVLRKIKNKRGRKKAESFIITYGHDFLHFSSIATRWAMDTYGLTKLEVETLLYLFGEGLFKYKTYTMYYYNIHQKKRGVSILFRGLMDKGHIVKWKGTSGRSAVYRLSEGVRAMCEKMHMICLGETPATLERAASKQKVSKPKKDLDVNDKKTQSQAIADYMLRVIAKKASSN